MNECCKNCPNNKNLFCNCILPTLEMQGEKSGTMKMYYTTNLLDKSIYNKYNSSIRRYKMTKEELEEEILNRTDLTAEQKVEMLKAMKEDKPEEKEEVIFG